MKKYNLSEIMHKAWKLYRKGVGSFAEALHRAWNSAKAAPVNAQRIEEAQQAAGITGPVNTWAGWKAAGYMVEHGAKALFQAVLIHSSRGDGQTYRASFFGASQVQPLDKEFHEKWALLDEDTREGLTRLIDQMRRANALGLIISMDEGSCAFFVADRASNAVVAPPPMNLPAVTAWLDTYERKSTTK